MVWLGPKMLDLRWGAVSCMALFLTVFSQAFFFDVFFERVLASIFNRFWKARNLKNSIFPKENNDFPKIDVFEKNAKNPRFWNRFRRPKRRKIEKKLCWKVYLFNFDFFAFFYDFFRFWLDFGRPRAVKKNLKIEKIDFLMLSVLKEASGRVLGRFWEDFVRIFKRICEAFWKDLDGQTMIRATKGKSVQ